MMCGDTLEIIASEKKNLHPNAYLEVYNDNQMFLNVHVILFIIK